MVCELTAVVEGKRMQIPFERHQHLYDGISNIVGTFVFQLRRPRETGQAVVDGDDGTLVVLADDGVAFQIPETRLLIDDGRPVIDVHPVGYLPPVLILQPSLGLSATFASEMRVHGATFLFVFPNHPIDCFVAYTVDAPDSAVFTDLFRAPVHAQFRDDGFTHLIRQPMKSDSGLLPFLAFSLRCCPVVDAGFLILVPLQFSAYRAFVHSYCAGYLGF